MVKYFNYSYRPLTYITEYKGDYFYNHFIEDEDNKCTSYLVPLTDDDQKVLYERSIREFLIYSYNMGILYMVSTVYDKYTGNRNSTIHKVTSEEDLNYGLPLLDFYTGLGTSV